MSQMVVPSPAVGRTGLWTMTISRECRDGVTILTVAGRLGAASSGRFAEDVIRELNDGQRRVLIDLGRVDYLSSAGVFALEAAARRAREGVADIVLCAATAPVRLVFDLVQIQESLPIEDTREAGISRLQGLPGAQR